MVTVNGDRQLIIFVGHLDSIVLNIVTNGWIKGYIVRQCCITSYSALYHLSNVVALNVHSMLRLQVALVTNNFEGGKC